MSFLNICLTGLICPRADIQDDAVLIMWSLNESLLSNTTPRSLTESTGKSFLPKRVRRKPEVSISFADFHIQSV